MDQETKYVNHPLDEHYSVEPTDESINHAVRIGPLEERDVHNLLLEIMDCEDNITIFDELWSQLFGPTRRFEIFFDKRKELVELASKSAEHRAAFCRMANGEFLPDKIKKDLKQIITESPPIK